jgi:hypothetical protein
MSSPPKMNLSIDLDKKKPFDVLTTTIAFLYIELITSFDLYTLFPEFEIVCIFLITTLL